MELSTSDYRIQDRTLLGALLALWGGLFIVFTVKGLFTDSAFDWSILNRRLTVCAISATIMYVFTMALSLQLFARMKPLPKALAIFLGAFPVAVALALVNYAAFYQYDPNPEIYKDVASLSLGRYFLVLMWSAFYLALEKTECVRNLERRSAEYRRAAQKAELRTLRYRINPNFLFDTLNSLSALIMTGRGDEAENLIDSLALFYRRALSDDLTSLISLNQEMEFLALYVKIQQLKCGKELSVEFRASEIATTAKLPGLILFPLIEVLLDNNPTIPIIVHASCQDEALVITIKDKSNLGNSHYMTTDGDTDKDISRMIDRLRENYGEDFSLELNRSASGRLKTKISLPLNIL